MAGGTLLGGSGLQAQDTHRYRVVVADKLQDILPLAEDRGDFDLHSLEEQRGVTCCLSTEKQRGISLSSITSINEYHPNHPSHPLYPVYTSCHSKNMPQNGQQREPTANHQSKRSKSLVRFTQCSTSVCHCFLVQRGLKKGLFLRGFLWVTLGFRADS